MGTLPGAAGQWAESRAVRFVIRAWKAAFRYGIKLDEFKGLRTWPRIGFRVVVVTGRDGSVGSEASVRKVFPSKTNQG